MLWRPRSLTRLLLLLAVMVANAGCSSLDREFEREGEEAPLSVESARFFMTTLPPTEGVELPEDLVGQMEGEISHGGDRARLGLDIPSVPGGVPGTDIEFILIKGGATYFRAPADAELMPKGKEWLLIPPDQISRFMAGFENYAEFLLSGNFLEEKNLPEEDQTGSELIRGVQTNVYSSTTNVDEMADAIELEQDKIEEIKSVTGTELELTMWLDEAGFVRRMDMPMTIPRPKKDRADAVLFRIELFDHGADDVDVQEPDPSEVFAP